MKEVMTSGEIARKAGVSQKAVRLYDEKGLLKPTDYSEGNYRLYDREALQILEKIVALKKIGFSLEEIRDNLTSGDAADIKEALEMQLKIMDEKRYQTEMVIDAIKRVLLRKEDLDWDDVASIVQSVSLDQTADLNHYKGLKHTVSEDWYVQIFRTMHFEKDLKVLDLGCGFSKIWRNNWNIIPEGTMVYAYDLKGTWADDFEKFISENKSKLPADVNIDLTFADLEEGSSWEKIESEKTYDRIIMHYVYKELKDPEAMIAHAAKLLGKDGFFSVNGPDNSDWDTYVKDALKDMGLTYSFVDDNIADLTAQKEKFREMVGKHFTKIDIVPLTSSYRYDNEDDIFDRFMRLFESQSKFFTANEKKIKEYFKNKIAAEGPITFDTTSHFLHCSN